MQINKITIQNFRNIEEETTFELHPRFTAIIGVNGKGKSTILHALRVACGAFFFINPDVKKWHIRPDEIRLKSLEKHLTPQKPVKVEAEGLFPEESNPIIWRRQILENTSSTTSKRDDVGNIRRIAEEKYQSITKQGNDKVSLPVIGFFGTSRAHGAGRNRVPRTGRQIFKDGYKDWYELKSTTFQFNGWLGSYDILEKHGKEYSNTKKAFFETLKKANRYIRNVEFIGQELWLQVEVEGTLSDFLPISYHSDGIRFFTQMVAELAYRCIVLNGYLDYAAITESRGIVMIDELDLHLHPNWQRHVVNDLKEAFPNLQFVATTHSSFIVQSLTKKEIINLDGKGLESDPLRYGIEDVSEGEMYVSDVARSEPFKERVEVATKYYQLIADNNGKSQEEIESLRQQLNEMEERFSEDPVFVAQLRLERKAKKI